MKTWLELSIQVPSEFVEPVVELFRRYSRGNIALEEAGFDPDDDPHPRPRLGEVTVRTYLPQTPAWRKNREMIRMGLDLVRKLTSLPLLQERELRDGEWHEQWKAHFLPLRIGRRLIVKPPWREVAEPDAVVIELDPGMAFGTGHHPTTWASLEALERLLRPRMDVLDVGTGSGILTIAAVKLGARQVMGLDVDPVAVKVARTNLRANGCATRAHVYRGTLPHPRLANATFDIIVANINAIVLAKLAVSLHEHLRPPGWLVASGIIVDRAVQVEEAFGTAGLKIWERIQDQDWITFLAQREGP